MAARGADLAAVRFAGAVFCEAGARVRLAAGLAAGFAAGLGLRLGAARLGARLGAARLGAGADFRVGLRTVMGQQRG